MPRRPAAAARSPTGAAAPRRAVPVAPSATALHLAVATLAVAGCGQKGPLYLPDAAVKSPVEIRSPAAPPAPGTPTGTPTGTTQPSGPGATAPATPAPAGAAPPSGPAAPDTTVPAKRDPTRRDPA